MDEISRQLFEYGVRTCGKKKYDRELIKEMRRVIEQMNGFSVGSNITINLLKTYQKKPTQISLDSVHSVNFKRGDSELYKRDVNLYMQLSDFVDLLKPRERVVIKFVGEPDVILVEYKKTQSFSIPWLNVWMRDYPEYIIEYCTDVYNYLRIMGPICSMINISNLLNRIENNDINYTLILLSLVVFPKSDISPITRNATIEKEEVLKSCTYEDVQRRIYKCNNMEDRLIYSRTRNLFNLPALSGTNHINGEFIKNVEKQI